MVRSSFEEFDQWAFVIGRRRRALQNGCAERLIGSIRRECIDHIIVIGERQLRHVLSYMIVEQGRAGTARRRTLSYTSERSPKIQGRA